MTLTLLVLTVIAYIILIKENTVVVYEGSEEDTAESQRIFWILKNNKLKPKYYIRADLKTAMSFGKPTNSISILVHRKYHKRAKELITNDRIEQRKKKLNIENERLKSEKTFS